MKTKAHPILPLFAASSLLAFVATGCSSGRLSSSEPDTSIPDIARLAGVAVGYSTQEDLARQWGEGKVVTGGHPNSGRVWRIKGTDWVVDTDGFDYSARGLVVDGLQLGTESDLAAGAPLARPPKDEFAWLGGIRLGMSRSEVEQFLKSKSLMTTQTNQDLSVQADGYHALVNGTLVSWVVNLNFKENVLTKLNIEACERTTR